MQIDTTIFGGLPVLVELTAQPAEPDVGIMRPYYEVDAIYTVRVRKRDRKLVKRTIPRSWWGRLARSGALSDLAEEALTLC